VIPVGFRFAKSGQPSRQVRADVQKVDDDHLVGILNEDNEVLSGAGKAQILGQIRIDEAAAIATQRAIRSSS